MDTITVQDGPKPDIFATIPPEETAAIIVPMYEMTKDNLIPAVNYQMLEVALLRLRSYFHKTFKIFVGEKARTTDEALGVVQGYLAAKNALLVDTDDYATLGMYLQDGLDAAMNSTTSKYFIFATPWQMVGNSSVDVLLERSNKVDVGIVSGFDVRSAGVAPADFDEYKFNPPREFRALDLNFWCITRTVADSLKFDPKYQTQKLLERDIFQLMHSRGYNVIQSQQAPMYTFAVDWSVTEGDVETAEDKEYFKSKWGFIPV
jgi:hypothetical protein